MDWTCDRSPQHSCAAASVCGMAFESTYQLFTEMTTAFGVQPVFIETRLFTFWLCSACA
jgi:hypothetical protein